MAEHPHPAWCVANAGELVCDFHDSRRGAHVGPYRTVPDDAEFETTRYVVEVGQGRDDPEPLVSLQDRRTRKYYPPEVEMSVSDARAVYDALGKVLAEIDESTASNGAVDVNSST